jgi:hypothetical protein
MIHNGWIPKRLVFAAAIASLAGVAVIGAIGLAYPQPVPSAALGPDWQCTRQAFVWTTCTRVTQARPAPFRMAREQVCQRSRIAHRLQAGALVG